MRLRHFTHRIQRLIEPPVQGHQRRVMPQRIRRATRTRRLSGSRRLRQQRLQGRPVRRGPLGLTLRLNLTRLGHLAINLCNQRGQTLLRRRNRRLRVLHSRQQPVRNFGRVLGVTNRPHEPALLASRLRLQRTTQRQGLLRLIQGHRRHLRVIRNRLQHLLRVLLPQRIQRLRRLRHTRPQIHRLLRQLIKLRTSIDQQVAHRRKLSCLRIQRIIRLPTRGHNRHQKLTLLRLRHPTLRLNLLMHRKRTLQGRGGLIHRRRKLPRALRPELRNRNVELLLATANGLIRGHELFLRELLQHRQRQARQRRRVRRLDLARGLDRRRGLLLSLPLRHRIRAAARREYGRTAGTQPQRAITRARASRCRLHHSAARPSPIAGSEQIISSLIERVLRARRPLGPHAHRRLARLGIHDERRRIRTARVHNRLRIGLDLGIQTRGVDDVEQTLIGRLQLRNLRLQVGLLRGREHARVIRHLRRDRGSRRRRLCDRRAQEYRRCSRAQSDE